jgi:pyrroline-5-carboxylate reductase
MEPPLRGLTISLIGAGTMGQAVLAGLLARGVPAGALRVADPNPATRRLIRRRFGVDARDDNAGVARRADVVILAVKPRDLPEVVTELSPHLGRRHLVISIAAGITLRWLQQRLPAVPVVRVMPNLAATVGAGFAVLAPGRLARGRHRRIALAIFRAVGEAVELAERHLDAVTAVSGSGPAYVFFLAQAWEEAARALGLAPSVAAQAIRRTLAGSARLLEDSAAPAAELIRRVASKRGTTEAALKVLSRRRVAAHLVEAIQAAARRSRELAWA